MLIDWVTVGAQTLNFIVLVWLLKRFLYKPILDAIDAREQRIKKELDDAAQQRSEAQKEREEFQRKTRELDDQRSSMLTKMTAESEMERKRLLEAARQAADALSAKRSGALRDEAHQLNVTLQSRTQTEVLRIARRVLDDLADAALEERMTAVFMQRVHALDGEAKVRLAKALKESNEPAVVRTAFDLPLAQRSAIQNSLNVALSADVRLRFSTEPAMVAGIELSANGQKIAWSIAAYLRTLELGIADVLKEKSPPEATHP